MRGEGGVKEGRLIVPSKDPKYFFDSDWTKWALYRVRKIWRGLADLAHIRNYNWDAYMCIL